MWVLLLASPINAFLQWMLVFGPLKLGFIGAPLAVSITYSLVPCMLALYIRLGGGRECWGGWCWRDALDWTQIKILLAMGFPGIIMICAEW